MKSNRYCYCVVSWEKLDSESSYDPNYCIKYVFKSLDDAQQRLSLIACTYRDVDAFKSVKFLGVSVVNEFYFEVPFLLVTRVDGSRIFYKIERFLLQ